MGGACHTNLQGMTRTFGAGACNRDRFPLGSSLDSPIWILPGRFSRSTLPETNMETQKGPYQDYSPLKRGLYGFPC